VGSSYDQGDFIRHKVRPEWGIGHILRRSEDRIDVQFQHGLVMLKLSVAGNFIEPVTAREAAAAGITTSTRRTGAAGTESALRRAPKAAPPPEPEVPEEEEFDAEED
jgi:Protein of unknown function (DUF3553)